MNLKQLIEQRGGLRLQGINKTPKPDKPLISVITATFNGAATLETTIRSVIGQTYDNVEYIIIDGGSTDATLSIIKKYEKSIDYWVSEPDCGIYDAFNKGVAAAQGDYYVIVGSDDELFTDALNLVVNAQLKGADVDFVVASMFLGDKLRAGMRPKLGWLGAHAMVNGHSLGMILRTKIHKQIGLYSTAYRLSADALFIKKLFSSGLRGVQSDVVMGRFSVDGASNANIARGLCEGFLVQIETERFKALQVIIFIARLIKNFYKL